VTKIIKNIGIGTLKFIGYFLELVIFLVIVLAFFIRTTWFQTFVAQQVSSYYSEKLGTEVTVDQVKIHGLDYSEVIGLLIKDQQGDTLIYSPKFTGSIGMLNLKGQEAVVKAVNSDNTRIKLQKYEGDSVTNIQFLVDYFSSEDTTQSEFKIEIQELALKNVHFSFDNWNIDPIPYGLDYNHLDVKHLTGYIRDIKSGGGETSLRLDNIMLFEKCGFILENLTTDFKITKKEMLFEDVTLKTSLSNLSCEKLGFSYQDFGDLADFTHAVNMEVNFEPSGVHLKDVSYFVPTLEKMNRKVKLEGKLLGRVNDFQLDSLYIGLGAATYFKGSADIKGLPDVESMVFFADIEQIQTTYSELDRIDFTAFGMENDIEIPKELDQLGVMHLSGIFAGTLDDAEANFLLNTAQGDLDLSLMLTKEEDVYHYISRLNTDKVKLGRILNNSDLGDLTSEFVIQGSGFTLDDVDTHISGELHDFKAMGYTYDNFTLDGVLQKKKFNGTAIINDDNLSLDFTGIMDFNKRKPVFDFMLDIGSAQLHRLKLIDRPTSLIKGEMQVKGAGMSIDDFDGMINLSCISYYENGIEYDFDSIRLISDKSESFRDINLYSEFADISMKGDFKMSEINESLYNLGSRIFPSLFPGEGTFDIVNEEFDLDVTIKDLSMVTRLFYPALKVAPNSKVGLNYVSEFELLELSAQADWIEHGDMRFVNFKIDTTQKFALYDPFYTLDIYTDTTFFTKDLYLENLSYKTDLFNDNVHSIISWNNPDSSNYGFLETDIDISSPSNMAFDIHPSLIYTAEMGMWHIKKDARVLMDTSSFRLDNLLAQNEMQTVRITGTVSENPNDRLKLEISSFDIANLNAFTADSTIHYKGDLLLTGYISNVYNNLYFDAYSWIEDLQINEYILGDLETVAGWNPLDQRIEFTGDLLVEDEYVQKTEGSYYDENRSTFSIKKGFYYVGDVREQLDFDFEMDKVNIEFVNTFMPGGFSNLQGLIDGRVNLKGRVAEPQLDGMLRIKDAGLNIDMLNTAYYASGNVRIDPDMISFNSLPIKDKLGAQGYLSGSFFHQNFARYSYDFFAGFDEPFLVMNTDYNMNPLYYGNAYTTGDIAISYDDYNELEIIVNAKSEKGTDITLPLYGSQEVVLQDFISFVGSDSLNAEDEYDVNLEGIQLTLNMDITEDADIQLVFDDVVGDMMRGTGTGHIEMYIDQFADFYMFGNYEITEGSYLFTLKDLINKKFKVKKGGSIAWYGDPYDADIDITAVYNLRTSLYDIMPENQRESYRQKTDVDCEMRLTENLFNPQIHFGIDLPRSDENAKSILKSIVNTETEMNKQVFALLLLNKFLPSEYNTSGSSSGGGAILGSTTSEMLSNQLSNMLSKFSDDFDIGFNYQPGDEISSQEVALALSTQLFDDRVSIRTNVGVSHQNSGESSNRLIGDVDVEYKINEEGNTRVHAFNRSNEYDITQQEATNTQGVGVFYQESFSTLSELTCKVRNIFVRESKECKYCNESCSEIIDPTLRKECEDEKMSLSNDSDCSYCKVSCKNISDPVLKQKCKDDKKKAKDCK